MPGKSSVVWDNKIIGRPRIEGSLEISKSRYGVFIGGDPAALRSFASLLAWLADVDQSTLASQPEGERCHVHLHANGPEAFNSLTRFSVETEVCRLDAKGSGEFPDRYHRAGKRRTRTLKAGTKDAFRKRAKRGRTR